MHIILKQANRFLRTGKLYTVFLWSFSFIVFFYLGDDINEKTLRSLVIYTSTLSIVMNADILGANNSVFDLTKISKLINKKYFYIGLLFLLVTLFLSNQKIPAVSGSYLPLLVPFAAILRVKYLNDNPLPLILSTSLPSLLVLIMYLTGYGSSVGLSIIISISVLCYVVFNRNELHYLLTRDRLIINLLNFIISSRFEILLLLVMFEDNLSSRIALLKLVGVTFALVDLVYGRKLPRLLAKGMYTRKTFRAYTTISMVLMLGIAAGYFVFGRFFDLVSVDMKIYLLLGSSIIFSSLTLVRIAYEQESLTNYILLVYALMHVLIFVVLTNFLIITYALSAINILLFITYGFIKKRSYNF
jgi:hypothetical protein